MICYTVEHNRIPEDAFVNLVAMICSLYVCNIAATDTVSGKSNFGMNTRVACKNSLIP
jgi:hypothetical protein